MNHCQCGGYLGSGGVDGYAGRWCRCLNPTMSNGLTFTSSQVVIVKDVRDQEIDELKSENKRLREVLEMNLIPLFDDSCEGCREAERVAREVLNKEKSEWVL